MQMVIIKYISVFCFTLFFGYNNCDKFLVEVSDDRKIRQLTACVANCLNGTRNSTIENCYHSCSLQVTLPPLTNRDNNNWKIDLLCRNETNLSFRISNVSDEQTYSDNDEYNYGVDNDTINTDKQRNSEENVKTYSNNKQRIFFLRIYEKDKKTSKQMIILTDDDIVDIGNLTENSNYTISSAVVTSDYEIMDILDDTEFSTLSRNFTPANIENITLIKFLPDKKDRNKLLAEIQWEPTADRICSYNVLSFLSDTTSSTFQEIRQLEKLYKCTLNDINVGSTVSVGIKAVHNIGPQLMESKFIFKSFEAPSCLEWFHNNLTICPPPNPAGLKVNHTPLSGKKYSINISWNKPNLTSDYYIINIFDLTLDEPNHSNMNVSGDQTSQYIPSIILNGYEYEVHLTAYSFGGNASTMLRKTINVLDIAGKQYAVKLVIAIIIPIVCITMASLLTLLVCHRRAKLKRYQERCKYFEELEKKAPVDTNSNFEFPAKSPPHLTSDQHLNILQQQLESKLYINDVMEIERDNVILLEEVLGEGAFGLVRKGITKLNSGKDVEVAVKMLKDNPSIEDIKEFRREIDVMKSVGDHSNIVGLIGHCTKNINEMLLLTEYCSRGNLLHYLRSEWQYRQNQCRHDASPSIVNLVDNKEPESIFNFDTSFIEKISISYKNIHESKTKSVESPPDLTSHTIMSPKEHDHNVHTTNIVVNNGYEMDTACTNSCKCQVDIIPKTQCLKMDEHETKCNNKIEVKGCKCRLRMLAAEEKGSPTANENHGYYKVLNAKLLNSGVPCDDEKSQEVKEDMNEDRLTSGDMLRIIRQIAIGMEFLSKNKVVHRDLAARNVLVCEDKSVKIADFGLSRDIYQENIYKKTGNGKLPIKWLAIESMTHQVYTSQSDVWSYGVLLYEIVTLGGTPYPLIPTNRLITLLKAGYRMEKPRNCSEMLYELMLSCWRNKPTERPTFTDICRTLDDFLLHSPDDEIIDFNLMENVAKRSKSSSEESYLKPI